MSVLITYFVHGTTTDNENNIATGILPGELSALGIQQSKELAKQTAELQFDEVFCSDLKRAIITAQLAFANRCTITQDKRLRECDYGDLSGGPHDFKEHMIEYVDTPFPNGGSYRDVENNIRDFVRFLTNHYDGKHIAIVAHQAPQLAFDVVLKGKTWQQAIDGDWRKTKSWQPGWKYSIA